MNWLRRLRTRWALGSETVKALLGRASDAIRETQVLERQRKAESFMAHEVEFERAQLRSRMNEVLTLRAAEVACVNPPAFEKFTEHGPVETAVQFKERLWELELALEDRGWIREVTLSNLEFSRLGVQQLVRITRIYAIKNPLIKRGAEICAMYVFGRGIEIRSEDDAANDVVQDFLERNQAELGHVGLADKERSLQTDGSLYFGLATSTKGVKVHMVDPLEMMEVITDPDHPSIPWFFYRQWNRADFTPNNPPSNTPMKAWYPSLEVVNDPDLYTKLKSTDKIGSDPVNWDMPVYRVKVGAPLNWRWGVPPLYASIDWGRAYKDALEDYATVRRAFARFALMVETEGGPAAIAAYNALLNTTFADNDGTQIEKNPPPVTGSAHISGPNNKITPFKSSGMQSSPEDLRRMMLMVAAAQGMPETFYGDASTGSLATAQSLDRPTELKFREIQQRWMMIITDILKYVVAVQKATPGSKMREAREKNPAPQPVKYVVKFPSILEHDISQMIEAWTKIGCMGGRTGIPVGVVDRRTIADGMLAEIGYENRGELLDQIYGDGKEYDPAADVTDQRSQVPPQLLSTPTGKALTDLSIPPPLPIATPTAPNAPPAPVAPGTPTKQTEALLLAAQRLREAAAMVASRDED